MVIKRKVHTCNSWCPILSKFSLDGMFGLIMFLQEESFLVKYLFSVSRFVSRFGLFVYIWDVCLDNVIAGGDLFGNLFGVPLCPNLAFWDVCLDNAFAGGVLFS